MNNIDRQYLELVNHILRFGYTKSDRTGTGTKSIFGWQIRHSMKDGFPLLTTKKMAWKTMVTELLWFLRGDTNIKYLVDNGCHIWDGDCYQAYLKKYEQDTTPGIVYYTDPLQHRPYTQEEFINKIKTDDVFAKKWGELGPLYGKQWRSWNVKQFESLNDGKFGYKYKDVPIDQIANAIHLLKTDPDSRRILVSAWNVGELDQMVLPPCHYSFQFYTRELSYEERCDIFKPYMPNFRTETNSIIRDLNIKIMNDAEVPKRAISLLWNQRSVDVGLGLPFNIASYALLLEIIAKEVDMIPEEVIGNLGDCHIYLNHIDGLKEQMSRTPYDLPNVRISDRPVDDVAVHTLDDFTLENYRSHPAIKLPLSN